MKKILLVIVACLSFSMTSFAAVNLNTATQAELESLKNAGPTKAQAIIDYRKKSDGFKAVEDLNNVSDFGDKTMGNLKSELTVSGATKVATATAKHLKPAAVDAKKSIKVAILVVTPTKTK
jgi:competence protein ComEA